MATYTGIKKIKIGDNVFELDMPSTAADVGIKFGYATSGNNRAVLQDSSGNLYVTQKDDNSDTKVSTAAVTSGTTYYPVVGADTTSAATKFYDKTGIVYKGTNGTTSAVGSAILTLGNSTASGTANNKQGQLVLYGSTAYAHTISGAPTAARTLTLPNATGTIALTSDIPDVSGKIDTAGTGLSKSGTTLNHSNAVAAQSTQAIYPIKIDGQGHISAYGTAVTPLTSSSSLNAAKLTGTVPVSCYTDTNTTYALSGALDSHAFTSTLTAGGSGSGTSTSVLTLAEGTGISLTDDATNNKITVGHSNSVTAGTAGTSSATSGSTLAVPYVTYDAQGHITATGTHTHTVSGFVPTTRTVNGKALSANIADADYITAQGNKTVGSITWNYRRTNGGDADAWATVSWSSAATSVWSSPVRYKDLTISIPSGIFSAAPRITATSTSTQYWVAGITVSSATSATIRFATVASGNFAFQAYVYAFGA